MARQSVRGKLTLLQSPTTQCLPESSTPFPLEGADHKFRFVVARHPLYRSNLSRAELLCSGKQIKRVSSLDAGQACRKGPSLLSWSQRITSEAHTFRMSQHPEALPSPCRIELSRVGYLGLGRADSTVSYWWSCLKACRSGPGTSFLPGIMCLCSQGR